MHLSSFPFSDLSPWEKPHDLVALLQYDVAKLQLIKKLGWDYLHDIQNEMNSWKEGVSEVPKDKSQEALLGVGSHPLSKLILTFLEFHALTSFHPS